jgi:hypothetical protein
MVKHFDPDSAFITGQLPVDQQRQVYPNSRLQATTTGSSHFP